MKLHHTKNGESYVIEERVLSTGDKVAVIAKRVRRERTGVHAFIGVSFNGIDAAHDDYNVDKDKDRTHLANSAHKQFSNDARAVFAATDLKYMLDVFSLSLWETWIGQRSIKLLAGNRNAKPAEFMLRPYIVVDGSSIIFAPPGMGKSYTVLLMAVSLDAADEIDPRYRLFDVTGQRRVLFVNLERSERSLEARLARVNMALGLPPERPIHFFQGRGLGLRDCQEVLYRDVRQHGIDVLFLDSLSRTGLGDLKEDQTGNKAVDSLNEICSTWVAIGHTPRDNANHLYGSVMFDAGEDLGILLKGQQREEGGRYVTGVSLKLEKTNDTGHYPPQFLRLEFEEDGLSGAFRSHSEEFPELTDTTKLSPAERLKLYIQENGPSTGADAAAALKMDHALVSRVFKTKQFVVARHEGTKKFYGLAFPDGNVMEI